jgi:hypothetical protein
MQHIIAQGDAEQDADNGTVEEARTEGMLKQTITCGELR